MFKIQYDDYATDAVIDADQLVDDPDSAFVTFTKAGMFVAAVKSSNVLSITKADA